jgi:hypothetical protein
MAIAHFNDLPQAERTLAANLLAATQQSIDMNRKVPRVWRESAYEYVAERIRVLALSRKFRNNQNVGLIDYSQFYGKVFHTVKTLKVRNVYRMFGNMRFVFQQFYEEISVVQDGED